MPFPSSVSSNSNNTLYSLSSQGFQGGCLWDKCVPASSLIFNSRRQPGTRWGLGVPASDMGTLG